MWQVLHNNTYVVPQPSVYSSHTTSPGDVEDSQTPLTPFFSNETHFWTSDTARDHQVFGYTYADVANKSRSDVITSINRLYGKSSPASMFMKISESQRQTNKHDERLSHRGLHRMGGLSWNIQTSAHPSISAVFDGSKYREWIANLRVNKHAMGGSFNIYLFIGEVPSDPSSWPVASSLVGTLGVFAHKGAHGHRGVHSHSSSRKVTGTIPMTSALMNMVTSGNISSLHTGDVEPFLRSNLEFRISLANGTTAEAHEVDGLCISIVSSIVKAPESEDTLSQWGEMENHFDLFA